MNVRTKLTSDIEGLAHQVDPLSRRGFFLTASAAAAAGYTLAAGPVSAQAIHTDTTGITVGDAKVKVADGEMPVYYAKPWRAEMSLNARNDRIYEYACHEGNYAMFGILGAARRREAETRPGGGE